MRRILPLVLLAAWASAPPASAVSVKAARPGRGVSRVADLSGALYLTTSPSLYSSDEFVLTHVLMRQYRGARLSRDFTAKAFAFAERARELDLAMAPAEMRREAARLSEHADRGVFARANAALGPLSAADIRELSPEAIAALAERIWDGAETGLSAVSGAGTPAARYAGALPALLPPSRRAADAAPRGRAAVEDGLRAADGVDRAERREAWLKRQKARFDSWLGKASFGLFGPRGASLSTSVLILLTAPLFAFLNLPAALTALPYTPLAFSLPILLIGAVILASTVFWIARYTVYRRLSPGAQGAFILATDAARLILAAGGIAVLLAALVMAAPTLAVSAAPLWTLLGYAFYWGWALAEVLHHDVYQLITYSKADRDLPLLSKARIGGTVGRQLRRMRAAL